MSVFMTWLTTHWWSFIWGMVVLFIFSPWPRSRDDDGESTGFRIKIGRKDND